ncbi:MAG TPA: MarR family transcriptional regulator [Acidimicrobiales bacterium]|nr:MarR family transcriptional regulator [Acidimicrobiales bacterium]
MTTTKTTMDRTTEAIAAALLSVARAMNQVRTHEMLCKRAGVDLDRSGGALLYKLYAEGEDVRLTELAERLAVDPPAVTRKVQQLERAGLLARSADPADARAMRLRLTPEGRHSIERLLSARQQWLDSLLRGWSGDDRREFARLLQLLASTIEFEAEVSHGG